MRYVVKFTVFLLQFHLYLQIPCYTQSISLPILQATHAKFWINH